MTEDADAAGGDSSGGSDPLAEVERLRAERDELRARLDKRRGFKRHRVRRSFAAISVVLTCIMFALSSAVVWTHATAIDTDHFVATVQPMIKDPAVIEATSMRLSNQIFTALDLQDRVEGALPPKLSIVAIPIANAAKGFLHDQMTKILASPRFQAFWLGALSFVHSQAIAALRGEKANALATTGGRIVVNLLPLVNDALQRLGTFISGAIGKPVKLPTLTTLQPPKQAVRKLSAALGVTLPPDLGQVVLYRANEFGLAQQAIRLADRLVWILPLVTLLLIGLAISFSIQRRRTIIQLVLGIMLVLVVVRRSVIFFEGRIADLTQDARVGRNVAELLFRDLFTMTRWLLVIGVVVLVVLFVSGMSSAATTFRRWTSQTWSAAVSGGRASGTSGEWISAHRDPLMAAGAIAAVAVLLLNVPWAISLVVIGLLALYELTVYRIALTGREQPAELPL